MQDAVVGIMEYEIFLTIRRSWIGYTSAAADRCSLGFQELVAIDTVIYIFFIFIAHLWRTVDKYIYSKVECVHSLAIYWYKTG